MERTSENEVSTKFAANFVLAYWYEIEPAIRNRNFVGLKRAVSDLTDMHNSVVRSKVPWINEISMHSRLALLYLDLYANKVPGIVNQRVLEDIKYDIDIINELMQDHEVYKEILRDRGREIVKSINSI